MSAFRLGLLSVLLAIFTASATADGDAQTSSWDMKGREGSQKAASAGLTALSKGQVDAGIGHLVRATSIDPGDPVPFALLGLALDMKGRYEEGLDALHKSFKLSPQVSETALSIGITHYLMNNYDKAINAFQHVLKLNPSLCHVHGDIGWAYLRKGDFTSAKESFRKLVACFPNSQFAYHGLATVKYLEGDFAGARKAADQAQSLAPYPPTLLLLAKLDVLQGDRTRAEARVKEYNKATVKGFAQRPMTAIGYPVAHDFRFDPFLVDSFDNANLLMARLQAIPKEAGRRRSYAKQGKVSQALAQASQALARAPSDFFIAREAGLLYLADGQYSEACDRFRTVIKLCPAAAVDLLHLARALAADGKAPEASACVRQFQRLFPAARLSPVFAEIARVDPGLAEVQTAEPVGGAAESKPAPASADTGF